MFLSVCALLCVCVCTCVSIYVCMCACVCSEYIYGRYSIGQRKVSDVLLSLFLSHSFEAGSLAEAGAAPSNSLGIAFPWPWGYGHERLYPGFGFVLFKNC